MNTHNFPEEAASVITFWFEEITEKQWYKKDDEFDALLTQRFGDLLNRARVGECYTWRETALGRLAEIIVLDQFSRNIFRDSPLAFAQDAQALVLAQEAVALGALEALNSPQQAFMLMPYMHSESALIHVQAVIQFQRPGLENNLNFEHRHKDIIDKFGRYPHRNSVLGRESNEGEVAFLKTPGSSF